MRYFFLFFSLIIGGLMTEVTGTWATNEGVACTMEYAPVCGSVQVQCIRAPCNPVRQTFGNACVARAAGATEITPGECGTIVGDDRDSHGCIPSAGYSWDGDFGKCVRPWEVRNFVLMVAPNQIACDGTGCLQVRVAAARSWTPWHSMIRNFSYEAGYTYRLRVKSSPTLTGSQEYVLAKQIQKIPLMGTSWILESLNGKTTTSNITLSFTRSQIRAKACNSMFGNYHLSGSTIKTAGLASTMMYCEGGDLMAIENAMNLSDAIWNMRDGKLTLQTTENNKLIWKLQ